MKKEELRIGNWVEFKDKHYQISSVHSDNTLRLYEGEDTIGCFRISQIKPIPLTEDWLIKFRFIWDGKTDEWVKPVVHLGENPYNPMNVWDCSKLSEPEEGFYIDHSYAPRLLYVHQLQNLYFALTGEELNIR